MEHIPYKKNPIQKALTSDEEEGVPEEPQDAPTTLSQEEQEAVMRKVSYRIVPFLTFLYVLSYLDRASLSNVHKIILTDLNMDEEAYANAAGIFFLGYILLGVPSNIGLVLVKARVWLTGIMVAWGSMCLVMMFAKNSTQLMTVRFFLGCAEAGFVPGVFLYMTYWFLPHERAKQLAMFISSNAMAGLLGGILAWFVQLHFEGLFGLHWWQYLFLIEGLATIIFGISIYFILPDSPASAKWLTEAEKNFLIERYRANNTESHSISLNLSRQQWISMLKTTLSDKFLWVFSVADFCNNGIMISITYFLPAIIRELGVSDLQSNLISAIPYGCALIVMMANAIHSDRKHERPYHIIVPSAISLVFGIALAIAILQKTSIFLQIFFICVVVSFVWSIKGPFLAWMTYGLRGNNAIGIGIVNSFANISGWVGPSIVAAAKEKSGDYVLGFCWQGALLVLLILSTYLIVYWEKRSAPPIQTNQEEKLKGGDEEGQLLEEFTII